MRPSWRSGTKLNCKRVVGSFPTRGNEVLSFLRCGSKTTRLSDKGKYEYTLRFLDITYNDFKEELTL